MNIAGILEFEMVYDGIYFQAIYGPTLISKNETSKHSGHS